MTVARRLAHVPVAWRPTELVVRVRRFTCRHCRRVWRQDTNRLAEPRLIDWRPIRTLLNKKYAKQQNAADTPAYDVILLFKILLLQT